MLSCFCQSGTDAINSPKRGRVDLWGGVESRNGLLTVMKLQLAVPTTTSLSPAALLVPPTAASTCRPRPISAVQWQLNKKKCWPARNLYVQQTGGKEAKSDATDADHHCWKRLSLDERFLINPRQQHGAECSSAKAAEGIDLPIDSRRWLLFVSVSGAPRGGHCWSCLSSLCGRLRIWAQAGGGGKALIKPGDSQRDHSHKASASSLTEHVQSNATYADSGVWQELVCWLATSKTTFMKRGLKPKNKRKTPYLGHNFSHANPFKYCK